MRRKNLEGENIDEFGECLAIHQIFIRQLFKSPIEMAGLLKYFKLKYSIIQQIRRIPPSSYTK